MKKTSKRVISLLLTLTLMFSAVMMFPSTASAASSVSSPVTNGYVFSGQVYFNSGNTSATAKSNFSVIAGITTTAKIKYTYRDSEGVEKEVTPSSSQSNASTSVPATVYRDSAHTLSYTPKYAYGVHNLSYNGYKRILNTSITVNG